MFHKFTAAILTCLMLVVATTSQAGLSYCLCEHSLFTGDCPCEITQVAPSNQAKTCTSCNCTSCSTSSTTTLITDSTPCQDCTISIDWKLADCTPQSSIDIKLTPADTLPLLLISPTITLTNPTFPTLTLEIRGSPPPPLSPPSIPLYLKHAVFLI